MQQEQKDFEQKNWYIRLTNGREKVKLSFFTKRYSLILVIIGITSFILMIPLLILASLEMFTRDTNIILSVLTVVFLWLPGNMFYWWRKGKRAPILLKNYLALGFRPIDQIDAFNLKQALMHYQMQEFNNQNQNNEFKN